MDLHADDVYLGQGTLRPDLIESASKLARFVEEMHQCANACCCPEPPSFVIHILRSTGADTIKTHHNDTQLVRELRDRGEFPTPSALNVGVCMR